MLIGLDFDNTIVCYDEVFERLALEADVPADVAAGGKTGIRDFLRTQGREEVWTIMQGAAYGSRMHEATSFPGTAEFVELACGAGHDLVVVSHRTREPYLGPTFDLHEAARGWLLAHDFSKFIAQVYFETTAEAKARRIAMLGCDVFVDDLWEFLERADMPADIRKIWLVHGGRGESRADLERATSWREVGDLLI